MRRFLEAPLRFATLATIDPDGTPHQAVVWFLVSHEGLILNSRVGRRWPTNLVRDPRACLTVEAGYDYVTMKGAVELLDDGEQAQDHIASMARRYRPPEVAEEMITSVFRPQQRVSFLFRARSIGTHGDLG